MDRNGSRLSGALVIFIPGHDGPRGAQALLENISLVLAYVDHLHRRADVRRFQLSGTYTDAAGYRQRPLPPVGLSGAGTGGHPANRRARAEGMAGTPGPQRSHTDLSDR